MKFRFLLNTTACCLLLAARANAQELHSLWDVYAHYFQKAKYVDLTHTITPAIPVWSGFGPSKFLRGVNPQKGKPYTYKDDGFEASAYQLSTDQLGTQLDPPAHWNPDYPAIDELPPTFAVRPLVIISIVDKVAKDPNYALSVADINDWEKQHGLIRSDWSKRWTEPGLAAQTVFPGVKLEALKFLHLERHILFHGHEPLDTDTTPKLEGEAWLLQNGYTQAEGVANLDQAPETGALVEIGYPKFGGGTGGYARFVAICPPDWPHGVAIDAAKESPLPKMSKPLRWDENAGMKTR